MIRCALGQRLARPAVDLAPSAWLVRPVVLKAIGAGLLVRSVNVSGITTPLAGRQILGDVAPSLWDPWDRIPSPSPRGLECPEEVVPPTRGLPLGFHLLKNQPG